MENVMTAVMKNLSKDMEGIEPAANMKMHQSLEACYTKSGGNPDRFADCVVTSNKKISDIVEPFQFKLLFISKSTQKCLQSKDQKKCIEEITTLGKGIVQNMVKALQKVKKIQQAKMEGLGGNGKERFIINLKSNKIKILEEMIGHQKQKRPRDQEIGQISNRKKQLYPLPQTVYYPQSILIDDYFLQHSQTNKGCQKTKRKLIKFVGDERQNIEDIIRSIDSLNECENKILMKTEINKILHQFAQILQVFYAKINKIRQERNLLKACHQDHERNTSIDTMNLKIQKENLKEKISEITKENQGLKESLEKQMKKKQYFERQSLFLAEKINLMNFPKEKTQIQMTENQFEVYEQMHKKNQRSSSKKVKASEANASKYLLLDKNTDKSINLSFKMINYNQQDTSATNGQIKSQIIGKKR